MADTFSNLKTLDLAALPSFYTDPTEAKDAQAGLAADRKLIRRVEARRLLNLQHVANAAATLETLPAAGETHHVICRGNWAAFDLIAAFLRLSPGATVRTLHIATLGFSRSNAADLLAMLDAGTVGAASMLISCFFRSHESEMVESLAREMQKRGQPFAAVRNHAKVIVAEMSTGAAIVVETSANLRSCRNIEQFTITNDAALLAFHQQWIDVILKGGDHK